MQATRTLLTIALLLSLVLSGRAGAQYPFESMGDPASVPVTTAPLPSRPLRGGLRTPRRPSREVRQKVVQAAGDVTQGGDPITQAGHDSPLANAPVHPPLVAGAMPENTMVDGAMPAGPLMPGSAAGAYDGLPYETGAYDTVPYESVPHDAGPFPSGDPLPFDYETGPYPGSGPGHAPWGRPYDTVPYEGYLEDEFGPAGGPPFDEPFADASLFGFDRALWPGFISGNLTPGTERFLYGGELFVPLYQDGRTMWYFNFRGQGDDNSASEFNTGTGVRVLTDPRWIFGAYTYWDHLKSRHGNHFNQGMIGVEAMSVLWDARMNVYFPESGGESAGPAIATVSNGNLVVSSGVERAYWGMDFELGHLLWAYGPNAQHEVRGFAAIYHFDHSAAGYSSITGPRVRGEYRWHDLPYFGPGSRFTFGLTLQADDERDAQLFAFARLRIPLDAWAHSRRPLSPLHRRMLDNVVRDVDIVTNTTRHSERAVNSITGREIRGFARIDANTSDIKDLLDDLDTDSLIVLDGSEGAIHAPTGHMLKTGQTVIGGDTRLDVVGARTNRRATFDPKGERPTLDFKEMYGDDVSEFGALASTQYNVYSPATGIAMNDNTQLIGVDIQNVGVGVGVRGAENVLVQDVEISDFSVAGIEVSHSSNVKLDDVRVRDAWVDTSYPTHAAGYPRGTGIRIAGSKNVEVTDSLVDDTEREGIYVINSQNVAIRRTKIRDTKLDGIRVLKSKKIRIEDVELKNTGKIDPDVGSFMPVEYQLSAITLSDTEDMVIRNSRIHGSDGNGIFGYDASSTLMHNLDIAEVENGIVFGKSEEITVTDSTFRFENDTRSAGPHLPGSVSVPHSGVVLWDATGEIDVSGNTIRGGLAGRGVYVSGSSGATDLGIENNAIDKSGGSTGIEVRSGSGNSLTGQIAGNTVNAPLGAFLLAAYSNDSHSDTKSLAIRENEWNGEFDAVIGDADVKMIVDGNHLGGDPMGQLSVEQNGWLELQYTGNTSTAGAGMLQILNDDGEVNATFNGNDHTPVVTAP